MSNRKKRIYAITQSNPSRALYTQQKIVVSLSLFDNCISFIISYPFASLFTLLFTFLHKQLLRTITMMMLLRMVTMMAAVTAATAFVTSAPTPTRHRTLLYSSYNPGEPSFSSPGRSTGAGTPNPIDTSPGGMLAQTKEEVWETLKPIKVQGGSLRTWSFTTPLIDSVQVHLKTEGRPLNCNVELWQGPDNTPQKMAVYLEDGAVRPFRAVIMSPGDQNSIAIRNTAQMEYPLSAGVEANVKEAPGAMSISERLSRIKATKIIQGGAVFTMPFSPAVASIQVLLKTDGRPLNARIELLQGPNNVKQVMEVYTEDGTERPFFTILETPGTGNVVRIVNTATIEFPISANVEPFMVEENSGDDLFVVSEDGTESGSRFFFMSS